jgi:hypothetical protein
VITGVLAISAALAAAVPAASMDLIRALRPNGAPLELQAPGISNPANLTRCAFRENMQSLSEVQNWI